MTQSPLQTTVHGCCQYFNVLRIIIGSEVPRFIIMRFDIIYWMLNTQCGGPVIDAKLDKVATWKISSTTQQQVSKSYL